jgi:TIR domain
MNLFRFLCKSCGALYQDRDEHGATKLVHRGLASSEDRSPLPTPGCVPHHDYVVFEPCGHCCPEVFALCRACKLGYPNWERGPGQPTNVACFCHYCVADAKLPRLTDERAGELLKEKNASEEFDVFLCHNANDKLEVKRIGESLRGRGIRPWLDVWAIRPGQSWLEAIAAQLTSIKSAAVFLGPNGVGPWQTVEIRGLLQQFVGKGSPLIPVVLRGTNGNLELPPELSLVLSPLHVVDFRQDDPDPMDNLEWGITGVQRVKT